MREQAQSSYEKESRVTVIDALKEAEKMLRCIPMDNPFVNRKHNKRGNVTNIHITDPEIAVDEVAKEKVMLNRSKFLNMSTDHGINLDFVDTVQELCVKFCELDDISIADINYDNGGSASAAEPHDLFDKLMLHLNPAGIAIECCTSLNVLLGSADHILLPTHRAYNRNSNNGKPPSRNTTNKMLQTSLANGFDSNKLNLELDIYAASSCIHASTTCRLSFGIYRKRDLHDAGITGKSIAAMKSDIQKVLENSSGRLPDNNRNAWVTFDVTFRERINFGNGMSQRSAQIIL